MKQNGEAMRRNAFSNRNGVVSISPRLAAQRPALGSAPRLISTPTGLRPPCAAPGRNPFRVETYFERPPRVARSSPPWAWGRNPVGIVCWLLFIGLRTIPRVWSQTRSVRRKAGSGCCAAARLFMARAIAAALFVAAIPLIFGTSMLAFACCLWNQVISHEPPCP